MFSSILGVIAIVLFALVLLFLFVVICLAASPKDRSEEDIEQMNFLKRYLKGKDDKN